MDFARQRASENATPDDDFVVRWPWGGIRVARPDDGFGACLGALLLLGLLTIFVLAVDPEFVRELGNFILWLFGRSAKP